LLNLVADISLPPASLAVLALALLFCGQRGRVAAGFVLVALIGLSLPIVATGLLNSLAPPLSVDAGPQPAAIVILSGDAIRVEDPNALEPGPLTLDRTRAGAALARRTGLPILVSGGELPDYHMTLAAMMTQSLHDDFRLDTRWQESRSRDTWENAEFSAAILREAGIKRIYLVTHDWHMRRSLLAFRHFGLDSIPVSVRPPFTPPLSWRRFVPGPVAWFNSYIAIHELVGLAYYTIRQ
jgi:uncharacterized SAM-binding protein YcdF (DUF218 family)